MKQLNQFIQWLQSPLDVNSKFGKLTIWLSYGAFGFCFDCPHIYGLSHSYWCSTSQDSSTVSKN